MENPDKKGEAKGKNDERESVLGKKPAGMYDRKEMGNDSREGMSVPLIGPGARIYSSSWQAHEPASAPL